VHFDGISRRIGLAERYAPNVVSPIMAGIIARVLAILPLPAKSRFLGASRM
jgi:hypothetical protein